jgi:hypothetical protein
MKLRKNQYVGIFLLGATLGLSATILVVSANADMDETLYELPPILEESIVFQEEESHELIGTVIETASTSIIVLDDSEEESEVPELVLVLNASSSMHADVAIDISDEVIPVLSTSTSLIDVSKADVPIEDFESIRNDRPTTPRDCHSAQWLEHFPNPGACMHQLRL